ncbi:hypothetical protein N7530_007898 [Penicillium desertorum]|uniref:Uncharacterized protein n=1 Tax=Penicillium desertorum TaxID=1303715 RepID=A0A9X0BKD3_9EURO|nr:hypothetical protein N7530_007898 [Penicillium desertorum]
MTSVVARSVHVTRVAPVEGEDVVVGRAARGGRDRGAAVVRPWCSPRCPGRTFWVERDND